MTTEFKSMILTAVILGLAVSLMMAWLETVREEQTFITYVYRGEDLPPADVSALHEEVRRIQRESNG